MNRQDASALSKIVLLPTLVCALVLTACEGGGDSDGSDSGQKSSGSSSDNDTSFAEIADRLAKAEEEQEADPQPDPDPEPVVKPSPSVFAPASLASGYALQMFGKYGLMQTYVIKSSTRTTNLAKDKWGRDQDYGYTYRRMDNTHAEFIVHKEDTGTTKSDMYWGLTFSSTSGGTQQNSAARRYRDGLLVDEDGVWAGKMTYTRVP